MSYSKIQSVFHCIHCWLSFDWAMPKCTFSLKKLLHNAIFSVASWKLGLPPSFTFCDLYAAGELSLNQKPVMMRASVLFVVLGFFSIPGPQTQSSDTWFSFIWLSKPISSFTGKKQEHFPSLRSLCVSLANSCLSFYYYAFFFLTICWKGLAYITTVFTIFITINSKSPIDREFLAVSIWHPLVYEGPSVHVTLAAHGSKNIQLLYRSNESCICRHNEILPTNFLNFYRFYWFTLGWPKRFHRVPFSCSPSSFGGWIGSAPALLFPWVPLPSLLLSMKRNSSSWVQFIISSLRWPKTSRWLAC